MAGRKQFDVDEALRRAMHVFWRWGYSEASIDRLTEGTGLGRGSLYGTFGDKSALFRKSLQRYAQTYHPLYEQALSGPHPSPSAVVAAYLQVALNRIADPTVPDGCLVTVSATQFPALDAEGRAMVRAMIDGLRARLEQALLAAGAGEQEAAELALCTLATNKSLAVLSRAGFSGEDLATVAAAAAKNAEAVPNRPAEPSGPRVAVVSSAVVAVASVVGPGAEPAWAAAIFAQPTAGTVWQAGTTQSIIWSNAVVGEQPLWLMEGDPAHLRKVGQIATVDGASGSYDWAIPANLPPASDYSLALGNAPDTAYSGEFTITSPGQQAAQAPS
ncbi:TetR family transcriptional regulator [Streptomyces sp. NBC_00554]|uniref:Ser-Thr-rich GPI-anchored membrane family protein n=1 Tax=Streptomyces sp. NBC_00554 TaxID=2903661 RepID=UPI00352FB850|nr:TetR family transcriptional regulator [Streptomyces sp. NBC_00554]